MVPPLLVVDYRGFIPIYIKNPFNYWLSMVDYQLFYLYL